jgi:major membrane immunogen (membrane-anchored lipoprotein)
MKTIMNRSIIMLTFAGIVLIINSCTSTADPLDAVKPFQPEDKYFKSALVTLHFVIETSPIPEVDTLFAQLREMYALPVDARGAKDGTFTGASPYDAFDYSHVVSIKIKDEQIVSVDYNEVNKEGVGKQEDEPYNEEMSVTGTTPAIAYPIMEEQFLETQNLLEVDAVSGASYSLQRFRYALTVALIKARL